MRELYEFRVDEQFANLLFAPDEGDKFGSVRRIRLTSDDAKFRRIGELQRELRETSDRPFFFGWDILREYRKDELAVAHRFTLDIRTAFEPAGEECGTIYDESTACPLCGSGAKQVGPLILDTSRIPERAPIAVSIGGEIVVQHRLADLFQTNDVTGVEFRPVLVRGPTLLESPHWLQLVIQNVGSEIVPPTAVGIDPFDDDPLGTTHCRRGDLIGLNLLTEVSLAESDSNPFDLSYTRQFVGVRRGLLRPRRVIVTSQKVWSLVSTQRSMGIRFEVAHLL